MEKISKEMIKEFRDLQSSIVSKMLRCNIFLPFGLDALNFEVIYTTCVPMGAPAATDFTRIYINPLCDMFATKDRDATKRQVTTLLLSHEICHTKLYHDKRKGKRDGILWNISCDFVINLLLQGLEKESKDQCPTSPLVDMAIDKQSKGMLIDPDFKGMLEEEIYDFLQRNGHFQKKTSKMSLKQFLKDIGVPDIGDHPEATDQPGEEVEGKGKSGKDSEDGQPTQGDSDTAGGSENDKSDQGDCDGKDEITVTQTEFSYKDKKFKHTDIQFPNPAGRVTPEKEKQYEENRQISRQMMESTLSKGVKSAELKKFLGRLFHVKVDWVKITKDSLMTAFEKSKELTWGHPRLAWLANPGLPYLPDVDEEERFGVAVFAIDESGSMGDKDVLRAVDIMVQAKEFYKGLLVIKHDHEVKWTKYYNNIDELDPDELCIRRHYGGTSHKEVFEFVTDFLKKNPEDMVSIFLSITDLCSDVEHTEDLMDPAIPRIYLVNCDAKNVVKGRIIRVDE